MNLFEHEGKKIFKDFGINIPKSILVDKDDDINKKYLELENLGLKDIVAKIQILSGKRGKNNGIKFCSSQEEVLEASKKLFNLNIKNQFVDSVLLEQKLDILEEHYLSIVYDTNLKHPVLIYSKRGGVDIEEVDKKDIIKISLDIFQGESRSERGYSGVNKEKIDIKNIDQNILDIINKLYNLFLDQDARLVEINPLVKTKQGEWYAADAKVALDEDAFYRHEDRKLKPRSMMGRLPTKRELDAAKIDEGEKYYRGTAGKYIDMDGDVAVIFSGGGASLAAMDAMINAGLTPANYTEYSGNPPREKVEALAKVVLSKPNLKGLWMAGAVANSTDVAETFKGIIDVLDEVKPTFPIVIRRAGPNDKEGMKLMKECAERNNLNIKLFGKEVGIDETVLVLADMINN